MIATAPALLTFNPSADGVAVDLDRLLKSRMLIQANSGGGKSWALRYVIEQTHGQVQQIILDPEGEFASLRERFPFVLAGTEGDVAADPRSAKLLCQRLLELEALEIIDLYDLPLAERRRFVRVFLDELIHLPRSLWHPLMLVLDEAHTYCPERGTGEAESTQAVIAACTLGRKRGYMPILATQRIAKLHKDAAAELLNVLVGRTGLDVDVRRAGDILGFDKEQRQALKYLDEGVFFAFGPAISREVVQVRTGEVVTSHPQAGTIAPPVPPAPEQLQQILAQLKDVPAQADEETRTLEAAQQRIAQLERQLAQRPTETRVETVIDRAAIEQARAAGYQEGMDEMAKYTAQIKGFVLEMEGHFRNGQLVIDELKTAVLDTPESVAAVAHAVQPAAQPSTNHLPISEKLVDTPSRAASNGHADAKLGLAERKILTVLAQYPQGRTKVQVALLAGYSVRGGGFGNALGSLRSRGYMTGSDHLQATEAGLSALGRWEPLPIGPALAEYWYGQLGLAERKILRVLVEANGQAMTKQQVADAVPSGLSCSGNRRSLVWYPGQR